MKEKCSQSRERKHMLGKRKLMRFCSERERGPVKSQVKGVEAKSGEVQVLLLRASGQLGSPN